MRRIRTLGTTIALVIAGVVFAYWYRHHRNYSTVPPASRESKPDRGLVKELAYQSKTPKYCRLAFGPEAEHHVWLVFDSVPNPLQPGNAKDYLYVDHNGNGDLTDEGERIEATVHQQDNGLWLGGVNPGRVPLLEFVVGDVTDNSGITHKDLKIQVGWFRGAQRPCVITATSAGKWPQRSELHELVFADSPADAPLLRFGGALTMRFALGIVHSLSLSKPAELSVEVGTPGTGRGTFVSLENNCFPEDLHPMATVEFPHRDANKPPIEVTVVLSKRC